MKVRVKSSEEDGKFDLYVGETYCGRFVQSIVTPLANALTEALSSPRILTKLLDGQCPDCGCRKFFLGPEGGLTQNVQCSDCGSRFNYCPRCAMLPNGFVERIS